MLGLKLNHVSKRGPKTQYKLLRYMTGFWVDSNPGLSHSETDAPCSHKKGQPTTQLSHEVFDRNQSLNDIFYGMKTIWALFVSCNTNIVCTCITMCWQNTIPTNPGLAWFWVDLIPGKHFKNAYEVINLRAHKFSKLHRNHIYQCMDKISCVEFQRYPLYPV